MKKFVGILIIMPFVASMMVNDLNDYKNHPCLRNCSGSLAPMECYYNFTVEWYKTLSKACYNCPNNTDDCDRPHCVAANGVERIIMAVNRMLPGPLIQVCQYDTINVIVHNRLRMGESLTIHWHGQLQYGTPHMDGAGIITQCPIHEHSSFQYRFKAINEGTYFWHSHIAVQRGDGVFGALVIKPKKDLNNNQYDYDLNEHVIIVNDWFDQSIIAQFALNQHGTTDHDRPTSILINGKGVDLKDEDNVETPRAIFTVKSGNRYRFRVINAGVAYCPIQIMVDNHTLTVIATDGKPIEPLTVEAVTLHAGERYDFVISANQKKGNYWIKAKGLGDCDYNEVFQTGILNYEGIVTSELPFGEQSFEYDSIQVTGKQLNNVELPNDEPNENYIQVNELQSKLDDTKRDYYEKISKTPNKKFYFGMEFKKINNPEYNDPNFYPIKLMTFNKQFYTPQINKISFEMPDVSVLSQYENIPKSMICNENNIEKVCPKYENETCYCFHLIEVDLNDLVEFIFVDETLTQFEVPVETIHPIHIHGHDFAVVSMESIDTNEPITVDLIKKLDKDGKIERNFDKPPIKDTVIVPDGGLTVFRFIADNPGVWLVHCHLDFHMETGMGFVLKVGSEKNFPKPPENWRQCGSYYYENDYINFANKLKFSVFNFIIILLFVFNF